MNLTMCLLMKEVGIPWKVAVEEVGVLQMKIVVHQEETEEQDHQKETILEEVGAFQMEKVVH